MTVHVSGNVVRLAGVEEDSAEFGEHCCQNCGFDLSDWRGEGTLSWKRGAKACDECPGCGHYPGWTSEGWRTEARKELLTCLSCGEEFIRRVVLTMNEERCGDRRRTLVSRSEGSARCDACGEIAQAACYEQMAKRARERSAKRREQQRRGVEMNRKLTQKQKAIARKHGVS